MSRTLHRNSFKILPDCPALAVCLLLGVLFLSPLLASAQPAAPRKSDAINRQRLEVIEDLSESLANDLLDLSVATRNQDVNRIARFLPRRLVATPLPSFPSPLENRVKWIARHGWSATANSVPANVRPRALGGEEFLASISAFLAHFSQVEDARFKVKGAEFDASANALLDAKEPTAMPGSSGWARVAFYVIGRDTEGRREWARGTAQVRIRKARNGPWQFVSFALEELSSMVATQDLFSEVSVPAGVAHRLPAYGDEGNDGFVWHGAAAGDFDGDGWVDVFSAGPLQSFLYRNLGNGRFQEVSRDTGLDTLESGVAPLALDYDNDGDLDVFLSNVGAQRLLENRLVPDGKLAFRDVSVRAGVAHQAIGFSAVAGDVNGDGWADIYVTCYNYYGRVTPDSWFRATNGTPNLLFLNQGDGSFREEGEKWGVADRRWSYAAAFADVNGDGRQDLYVANDFGENALFIHHGDHFVDEARQRGVLDPGNGMGVSFGDYNNDGRLDLHVTNMSSTAGNRILSRLFPGSDPGQNVLVKLAAGNNLYQNTGDGHFRDVTAEAGGFSGGWAWGGGFFDFDNDGWEDLFTPNGFISGKSMKDT